MNFLKLFLFALTLSCVSNHVFAQFYLNGSDKIYTYDKVGIGTYNPQEKLDVAGNVQVRGADLKLGTHDGRSRGTKTLQRALVHGNFDYSLGQTQDKLYINFNGDFEGGIRMEGIGVDIPNLLRINGNTDGSAWKVGVTGNMIQRDGQTALAVNSGEVTIGTTQVAIGYKLSVDGSIMSEGYAASLSQQWPDYVFDKDYKLASLEEVATHIATKGHLHNMPSAEDLEAAGGVELVEMTRQQQEKIEEVYLHLIEMNKTLKALKTENAGLKSKINELEKS